MLVPTSLRLDDPLHPGQRPSPALRRRELRNHVRQRVGLVCSDYTDGAAWWHVMPDPLSRPDPRSCVVGGDSHHDLDGSSS